jgi:hypothetical protein
MTLALETAGELERGMKKSLRPPADGRKRSVGRGQVAAGSGSKTRFHVEKF